MIQEYEKDGKRYYRVREFARSNLDPMIRKEKSKSGIEKPSDAKRISKVLLRKAQQLVLEEEQRGWTWQRAIDEWEISVRDGDVFANQITKQTLDDYRTVLLTYTSHWLELSVKQIDKAEAWSLMEKVEREVSVSRRKRLRTAVDAVFRWGILSGRFQGVTQMPTDGYKTVHKEEEKMPEILNLQEIRTLLEFSRRMNHPWHPVWALALYTGMRSGELFALEWSKVDSENAMITVDLNWTSREGFGPTKGRYWRSVPINRELMSILRELKVKDGASKYVLPRFQSWKDGRQAEILREFCQGAGIPSVKFHTLRACFATQLIRDGIAPAVVMKVSGWKDLKTMQRYIRLAGIEIKGATEGLKLLSERETMGRVVDLFGVKNEGV